MVYGIRGRRRRDRQTCMCRATSGRREEAPGWHTHPGHSLIIVTAGTVTAYEGHDPGCKPTVYTEGMGFLDQGGGHVHILRNEGAVEARTITVQLIPEGAVRRIDAPAPENCSNVQ